MSLRRAAAALAATLVALSAAAADYAEPFEQARFDAALGAFAADLFGGRP
mgnify:CR=1 FL=1